LQAPGQNKHAHGLDQADPFLLDVVVLGMRMENSLRVGRVRTVIAQNQIDDVGRPALSYDGSNRIVRSVRFGKYADGFVRVAAPGSANALGALQSLETVL